MPVNALVDQPLVPEHVEPSEHPDQIARPEWNDRDQDPDQSPRRPYLGGHEIGEGKAQEDRERGCQCDQPERAKQHPPIGLLGEEPGVVRRRPVMDDPSVFSRPEGIDELGRRGARRSRPPPRAPPEREQRIFEAAMTDPRRATKSLPRACDARAGLPRAGRRTPLACQQPGTRSSHRSVSPVTMSLALICQHLVVRRRPFLRMLDGPWNTIVVASSGFMPPSAS